MTQEAKTRFGDCRRLDLGTRVLVAREEKSFCISVTPTARIPPGASGWIEAAYDDGERTVYGIRFDVSAEPAYLSATHTDLSDPGRFKLLPPIGEVLMPWPVRPVGTRLAIKTWETGCDHEMEGILRNFEGILDNKPGDEAFINSVWHGADGSFYTLYFPGSGTSATATEAMLADPPYAYQIMDGLLDSEGLWAFREQWGRRQYTAAMARASRRHPSQTSRPFAG